MVDGEFTLKQQKFIVAYAECRNASQAAREAGYAADSSHVTGSQLLAKPNIHAACMELIDKSQKKAVLTLELLDQEIAKLAFADIRKLYDGDGNLLPVNQWPDDAAATVASIESVEEIEGRGDERRVTGMLKKLKVWDKVSALTLAAKRLGAISDSKNVNVNVSLEVLVAASMKVEKDDDSKIIEHQPTKNGD